MTAGIDVHPYLNFNGNCAEAFRFYETVLGGKILTMQAEETVIHACLEVNGRLLMASDAPPEHYKPAQGLWVNLTFGSTDEARRVFTALAAGGTIAMPFEETFWSPGFGMLTDRFGTPWMINTRPS